MATAAQITANRANSQLCTGPTTEAGKERSSQNALKHGLFSRRVVLPHESQDEYDSMLAETTDHYQPVGPQESTFVREVVDNYWKLQRDVGGRQERTIQREREYRFRSSPAKFRCLPSFDAESPRAN
jgi:hypothetical protein